MVNIQEYPSTTLKILRCCKDDELALQQMDIWCKHILACLICLLLCPLINGRYVTHSAFRCSISSSVAKSVVADLFLVESSSILASASLRTHKIQAYICYDLGLILTINLCI